jgi:hypothetical protein
MSLSKKQQEEAHWQALRNVALRGISETSREWGREYQREFRAVCAQKTPVFANEHFETLRRCSARRVFEGDRDFGTIYGAELAQLRRERAGRTGPPPAPRTWHPYHGSNSRAMSAAEFEVATWGKILELAQQGKAVITNGPTTSAPKNDQRTAASTPPSTSPRSFAANVTHIATRIMRTFTKAPTSASLASLRNIVATLPISNDPEFSGGGGRVVISAGARSAATVAIGQVRSASLVRGLKDLAESPAIGDFARRQLLRDLDREIATRNSGGEAA